MTLFQSSHATTIWLTGLSGAGKSTLAQAMQEQLLLQHQPTALLDGDLVRQGLCADLGFDTNSRSENIRRIAHTARLLNQQGIVVICATISPYKADRQHAKDIIGEQHYLEVYINTSLAICEQRDPKGLYKRARAGAIAQFTGISAPYEAPEQNTMRINTEHTSITEACHCLLKVLSNRSIINDSYHNHDTQASLQTVHHKTTQNY